MELKTLYDWRKGERGRILEPRGKHTPLSSIVVLRSGGGFGGVLAELYRTGGLYGQALVDAEAQFGKGKGGTDGSN